MCDFIYVFWIEEFIILKKKKKKMLSYLHMN